MSRADGQVKIAMDYDGEAAANPFVATVGEWVGICAHEPRPLHLYRAEPITVRGRILSRFNLCRACGKDGSSTDPAGLRLSARRWTQADLDRVAAAGRAA